MIEAFKDKLAKGAAVLVVNPDHPSPNPRNDEGELPDG